MDTAKILPPGSTIGILGGGQLGRMTALAAARLGYRCIVFSPEERVRRGPGVGRPCPRRLRRRRRPRPLRGPGRRHHLRVRERARGRRHRVPAPQAGAPGRAADPCRPAPAAREGVLPLPRHRHRRLPADPQRGRGRRRDRPARHPEDLHRGLRRQGPGARRQPCRAGGGLGEARPARVRAGGAGRLPLRDLGHRGARARQHDALLPDRPQRSPRRHPAHHDGALEPAGRDPGDGRALRRGTGRRASTWWAWWRWKCS